VYDRERDDGTFAAEEPPADWDPAQRMCVCMPPWHPAAGPAPPGARAERERAVKNPVSVWRVARRAVADFVFSPDVKYVAAIAEDGCLRVIDALAEQ
jgi:hypothetical protein